MEKANQGTKRPERLILGIDPGSNVMGYGLLRVTSLNKPELVDMGVLDFRKVKDHYLTLRQIFTELVTLIDRYVPDEMCLEAPFFGKNVQSMLKLGRAQGVAMAAGLYRELPIAEYAPLKVKMAITGNGQAAKEQVAYMLQRMLHIPDAMMPEKLDATDALGVAMCHYIETSKGIETKGTYRNWKEYARRNASRVTGETESEVNEKNAHFASIIRGNGKKVHRTMRTEKAENEWEILARHRAQERREREERRGENIESKETKIRNDDTDR